MKKFCLALDLQDDPALIAEYEAYHKNVWPEIVKSIKDSGIINMEIYRTGNRLMMIMETSDDFSFERKAKMDGNNPLVREWETLMWRYQKALPHAQAGEKWKLMDLLFCLPNTR